MVESAVCAAPAESVSPNAEVDNNTTAQITLLRIATCLETNLKQGIKYIFLLYVRCCLGMGISVVNV